jgi:DivIVA domain-containing protein
VSGALFPTTAKVKKGYDCAEVDHFFDTARAAYEGKSVDNFSVTDIQTASFELVRGGYETAEVDAALDRLAAAFVARTRAQLVSYHGEPMWHNLLADRARTLYPRLSRKAGMRFAPPGRGEQGYETSEVDAICDRLVAYFDKDVPLTAAEIRNATFTKAKGKGGYSEGPVDAFLARAVEVLLGVE